MFGRNETLPDCLNDSQPETDTPETGLWIMPENAPRCIVFNGR